MNTNSRKLIIFTLVAMFVISNVFAMKKQEENKRGLEIQLKKSLRQYSPYRRGTHGDSPEDADPNAAVWDEFCKDKTARQVALHLKVTLEMAQKELSGVTFEFPSEEESGDSSEDESNLVSSSDEDITQPRRPSSVESLMIPPQNESENEKPSQRDPEKIRGGYNALVHDRCRLTQSISDLEELLQQVEEAEGK